MISMTPSSILKNDERLSQENIIYTMYDLSYMLV